MEKNDLLRGFLEGKSRKKKVLIIYVMFADFNF